MIVREQLPIEMLKDVTCTAGKTVIDMSNELGKDEELKVKLVIGKEKINGQWPVYLDEEAPKNLVGKIKTIGSGDTSLDDWDISALVNDGNYQITLTGPQNKVMKGTLSILKDEATANRKSDKDTDEEVAKAAEEAVSKGYVTKEDMDLRLKVMAENGVDRFLMLRVIRGYRKYNKPAHKPSCIYVDPYLESSRKKKVEGIIAEGLRAAVGRMALICEGEKSVGKNVYLETIAWLMNMPLYLITFSRQMSPSSIYGEKTTDNSAAKALTEFDPMILAAADRVEEKIRFSMNLLYKQGVNANDAMKTAVDFLPEEDREVLKKAAEFRKLQAQSASVNIVIDASELYDWLADGGLMCFNEMNMCEPNFLASFANQLLDGTGFLFIPGRGDVPIHKDCVLFGTQNADYAGVEQQNEATVSRFGCLVFPQPESIKKQLKSAVASALKKDGFSGANLPGKYFDECEAFYKQCRGAVRKQQVTNACLNIRGFVRALTTVAESDGFSTLLRNVELHVINTCETSDRVALYSIAQSLITL